MDIKTKLIIEKTAILMANAVDGTYLVFKTLGYHVSISEDLVKTITLSTDLKWFEDRFLNGEIKYVRVMEFPETRRYFLTENGYELLTEIEKYRCHSLIDERSKSL